MIFRVVRGSVAVIAAFAIGWRCGEMVATVPSPYNACVERMMRAYPGEGAIVSWICREWRD